ncbi:MAG: ChaN family lipoprotein [Planctomycetes bacterium]|nr:ChaN family lipoprotein [Planctomycetota bacterium]
MRVLSVAAVLLLTLTSALAQEEPTPARGDEIASGEAKFLKAGYARELWVGLAPESVGAKKMLKQLRESCDDTTSVAVIESNLNEGVVATKAEQLVVCAVSARAALRTVILGAALRRNFTRVVLVGALETCPLAVQVVSAPGTGVEGLVLIDPPVGDINVAADLEHTLGVDVLLHPRSANEGASEETQLVAALGPWGKSARIQFSDKHFDNLGERISELRSHIRGYTVLQDDMPSTTSATDLAAKLKDFDVVFVGELHGNAGAHRVQLEMLRWYVADKRKLALATEQFERDVQPLLDQYLAGKIDEAAFLKDSRPWPNYADYRPQVELCRESKVHVIAANIPRRLASRVFKEGPEVVEKFTDEEKSWCAAALHAAPGAYRDKFMKQMGGADGHNQRLENMYASQSFKDDTMAESVANWLKANKGARVVHINGNFHSAGGLGVPEKLAALMPDLKIAVVTCVEHGEEADAGPDEWVIHVPASRPRRE